MTRTVILIGVLCAFSAVGQDWSKLNFVLGKWVGVAGANQTQLGAGSGEFSFDLELDKHIVVRRNHSGFDKGVTHDDLMVIYLEGVPRAIYFDSEGHTIRYSVTFPAKDQVVFESDGTQPGPKYRLSYWMEQSVMKGKFEVAAPPAGEFKTYMSWGSVKK